MLSLVLVACFQAIPEAAQAAPPAAEECERLRVAYSEARSSVNSCETMSDCAQSQGVCPEGAYYHGTRANIHPVWELETQLQSTCALPPCEEAPLPAADCRESRCVTGRPAPENGPFMACWDAELRWLEPGQGVTAKAQDKLIGTTPLMALEVPSAGVLSLAIDWTGCPRRCSLQISEHNSGMSRLVQGERTRSGAVETVTLPVTEGPYYFVGRGSGNYGLLPTLVDAEGKRMDVVRHGASVMRLCEG